MFMAVHLELMVVQREIKCAHFYQVPQGSPVCKGIHDVSHVPVSIFLLFEQEGLFNILY